MAQPSAALPVESTPEPSSAPYLLFVKGEEKQVLLLTRTPLTIGRKPDKDLSLPDPRVSRDHALIAREQDGFYIEDLSSKQGTFVNGARLNGRRRLARNDRIEFGPAEVGFLIFYPDKTQPTPPEASRPTPSRELLTQIAVMQPAGAAADLERLSLFLEAASKLNTTRVLDEILVTLIEATLRLTRAERGFVFLRTKDKAKLRLAAGRDASGRALTEDSTISHSILRKAVDSGSEFLVADTSSSAETAGQQSIVAFDLRTVICIPLLRHTNGAAADVSGALYLDSRHTSRDLSGVSNDLLRAIAREAAALVENAELMQEQERARRYEQELAISAGIQQRLMTVNIPSSSFAQVKARNLPCKAIGGDFFDVVSTNDGLAVAVADVAGKGVSAALLASILQGMIFAQLHSGVSLEEIAAVANGFVCQKDLGEKYATLTIARLRPTGELEFINCGHVPPALVRAGKVERTAPANPPVGLIPGLPYKAESLTLAPGDRLVIVTDGITEAQDAAGEFFGDQRLEEAIARGPFDEIFADVQKFCGETPFNDDCTVLELKFQP